MSKVVIITGSDGGIGKALSDIYLSHNYFVIGMDRNYINYVDKTNQRFIEADLFKFVKDETYKDYLINLLKESIPLNVSKLILINNAAEQIINNVENITTNDFERSLMVNALAPFFLNARAYTRTNII